jgi:hypothetical protein
MIRINFSHILVSFLTLIYCLFFPAPAYGFPSIHEPPVLESDPSLLGSSTQITLQNADRLVLAGEIRFSPWELVSSLAWSPDGEILAIAAGEKIHLLHTREWRVLASYSTGAPRMVSIQPGRDCGWLRQPGWVGALLVQPLSSHLETQRSAFD